MNAPDKAQRQLFEDIRALCLKNTILKHINLSFFLLLVMIFPSTATAHNGAVALAYPVDGIIIDGNLDDWPDDIRRYPITNVEYGDPIENADDFKGWFRIGYNIQENTIYLAVEVGDESAVRDSSFPSHWQRTDGCNVYLDSSHSEKDSTADQFITYGYHRGTRLSKQAVQWEWKRQGDLYRYEWRLNVDKIGGNSIHLKPEMTIGWDIAVCDKDGDGSFSWVSWGRGADKRASEEKCGDVVLMAARQSTGWLQGKVTWQKDLPETEGENVLIRSLEYDDLLVQTRTKRDGIYRVELPEGNYKVQAGHGRRKSAIKTIEIRNSEQEQANLSILTARGWTVTAGPGKSVKAVGSRIQDKIHLRIPYGLTNVAVKAIVQSNDSYLWLATNQGLARYDGEVFTFFTTEDGLSNDDVHALKMDRLGRLLVGTSVGVCVYDGKTFTHFTTENGLINNRVNSLLEDSEGKLWIGTKRGVSIYDGETFTHFTTEDGLQHNDIIALLEDRSGRIWLGTSFAGVSVYDGENFTNFTVEEGLIANRVRSLLEDSTGRIWIGTLFGISVYDGEGFTNFTKEDGMAGDKGLTLFEDSTGRIWIGNNWKGLSFYYQGKLGMLANTDSLPYASEWTFLEDREGNIWWGTDNGLIQYDHMLFNRFEVNELLNQNLRTILEDSAGRVWIGSDIGLKVYDGEYPKSFTKEDGLAGTNILSLLEDSTGRIWIGTHHNGVSVYDGNNFASFNTKNGLNGNQVRTLMEDSNGRVWIGTDVGVSIYDGGEFSHLSVEDGLLDNGVRTLLEDRTGNIWIGTAFGINVYDGENLASITRKDGLVSNNVHVLLEDSSGRIWIGTRDAGVSVYDGENFTSFTKENGLVCDNVHTLLEDEAGHIWVGTWGGGVSRYDGKCVQSLTHEDGLPSNNVAALIKNKQGSIWIGTVAGVVHYHSSHTPPPVLIVDVVTDRRHGPIDQVRLPNTESLAFEYLGLSFKTRPGGMVYRYRLNGYDTQWQTTNNRRVEYHDLPRGDYSFEVQAIDRDLSYSEAPAQVAVAVHLPYRLITFWISVTAALLLGFWEITRISQRGRKLRAARDELEFRVERRTSELSISNAMLTEEINERKRVEKALTASEIKYKSLFDNSIEGIGLSWVDRVVSANKALLDIFGYDSIEEFTPILDHVAPESREKIRELFERAEKNEELPASFEYRIICKNGQIKDLEVSVIQVSIEGQKYIQCTFRDVTERKKQEKLANIQRDLAIRLSTINQLDKGLALCLETAIEVSGMDCGGIYLVDEDSGTMELVAHQKLSDEFIESVFHYDANSDNIKLIMKGEPVYTEHKQLDVLLDETQKHEGLKAIAVVPVLNEGQVIGCLNIASRVFNKINAQSRLALETVAAQIGSTVARLKTAKALRESEERLRLAVQSAQLCTWDWDLVTDEVWLGGYSVEVLGLNSDVKSMPVSSFQEHINPEDLERIQLAVEEAINKQTQFNEEYRIVRPDGTERWVAAQGQPLYDNTGKAVRMIGVNQDITERKRLEEAYHSLVDHSIQGLAIIQEERMVFINKAFSFTTGYSEEEILSMSPEQLRLCVHPDDREMIWSRHRDRLSGKPVPHRYEFRWIRKDGSFCWIEIHASRIEYQSRPAIQIAFIETTERKKAEEKLIANQSQLRSLASELSLAEERQRRHIAAELHDQISQSLALSKINLQTLGQSEGLADNSKFTDVIKSIKDTIEQVRSLTFDLSSPTLYKFGLEKAIDELLCDYIKKMGVTYKLNVDKSPKPLEQDVMVLLYQSVRELLINIVKHAHARKVAVTINREDDNIRITVSDDGVGFQADRFISYGQRTGGFGLFNIRERLNYINGSFKIKSQSGKGSRITLTAPLKIKTDSVKGDF